MGSGELKNGDDWEIYYFTKYFITTFQTHVYSFYIVVAG